MAQNQAKIHHQITRINQKITYFQDQVEQLLIKLEDEYEAEEKMVLGIRAHNFSLGESLPSDYKSHDGQR
jgi:hypothetical protein